MLIAAILGGVPAAARAQALDKCHVGEQVTDNAGQTGVIVAVQGEICRLRYADGQTRGWASWSLRPAAAAPPPGDAENSIVLRPYVEHRRLVYHADRSGHFTVAGTANGAPVRFLVDTGATLVFLTPKDAEAAGIDPAALRFDQMANTGSGPVRIARLVLSEVRIDNIAVDHVPAAIIEKLGQSVLGMSFLARLKSFEIRSGVLTIDW